MCDILQVYIQLSADKAEWVCLSNVANSPVLPDMPQTLLLNMNGADSKVEYKIIAPSGTYTIKLFCFNLEHSIFLKKWAKPEIFLIFVLFTQKIKQKLDYKW